MLIEWGDYVRRHLDFANEWGENLLYRYSQFGYTDPQVGQMKHDEDGNPIGRDSVLCPDMPRHLRRIEIAVNCLNDLQGSVLRLFYCAPLREDGQPYTISQMARALHINKGRFRAELRKGRRAVESWRIRLLDEMDKKIA